MRIASHRITIQGQRSNIHKFRDHVMGL